MSTVTKKCRCHHRFQDEEHGKGNRVHNLMRATGNEKKKCRCTVCGDVKEV